MIKSILTSPKKWTLWGIPVLFAIGSGLHFVYDLLGENRLVGAVVPVNESIWEHIKLALLPVVLWWTLYYLLTGRQHGIDGRKWFAGALAAVAVSRISIPSMYYLYTAATGKELMWVDILIYLIAIAEGQQRHFTWDCTCGFCGTDWIVYPVHLYAAAYTILL